MHGQKVPAISDYKKVKCINLAKLMNLLKLGGIGGLRRGVISNL